MRERKQRNKQTKSVTLESETHIPGSGERETASSQRARIKVPETNRPKGKVQGPWI